MIWRPTFLPQAGKTLGNVAVKILLDCKRVFQSHGLCSLVTQTLALWQAELWGKMSTKEQNYS